MPSRAGARHYADLPEPTATFLGGGVAGCGPRFGPQTNTDETQMGGAFRPSFARGAVLYVCAVRFIMSNLRTGGLSARDVQMEPQSAGAQRARLTATHSAQPCAGALSRPHGRPAAAKSPIQWLGITIALVLVPGCSEHQASGPAPSPAAKREVRPFTVRLLTSGAWGLHIQEDGSGVVAQGSLVVNSAQFPSGTFTVAVLTAELGKRARPWNSGSACESMDLTADQASVTRRSCDDTNWLRGLFELAVKNGAPVDGSRIGEYWLSKPLFAP